MNSSLPESEEFVDLAKVKRVRKAMQSDDVFRDLADTFMAMGDATRTKLLFALGMEELCVGDLAALLGLSPSAVSHQLRLLRHLRLVRYRREGKVTYYALDDEHIDSLMSEGFKHVNESRTPSEDTGSE